MTFRSGAEFDNTRARSGGGGRRGGTIAAGGGIGTVVLIGIFLLLGGSPSDIGQFLGSDQGQEQSQGEITGGDSSDEFAHCRTAEDGNKYDDCRVMYAAQSIDQVWETLLPREASLQYTKPGLVIFHDSTQSGCGIASGATGPFYCPTDQTAYFDTAFFSQLHQFGAEDAPLAQMYIVAHEFGHHIQQLEGTLGLSNYNEPGEDSNAVKIELQADCYAGIWAHHADDGADALLDPITDQQARSAIDAARAVGDDNIQERSGGQVRPDQWTHGSSEQRAQAFLSGYQSGKMASCDFLGRGVYSS
ncbi:KPN_02809 family neutral zinc metallopeptidase [Corynebacterium flavescens]